MMNQHHQQYHLLHHLQCLLSGRSQNRVGRIREVESTMDDWRSDGDVDES